MPAGDDFPPPDHVGRDLRIAYRLPEPGRIRLTIPCVPQIQRADRSVYTEVVATIIDEAVGFVAVLQAQPDWGSTAALNFGFTNAPVQTGGEVTVEGRVLKAGKRLIFVEGRVTCGEVLVAHAEGQFARVGRTGANVSMEVPAPDPDEVWEMGSPGVESDASFPERLGMRPGPAGASGCVGGGEDGVLEMSLTGRVQNSSGILHGGVAAALAIAPAELAAGGEATHASVQFLSAGREGPFRSIAQPYPGHRSGIWHTTTVDVGSDRTMVNAVVTTSG